MHRKILGICTALVALVAFAIVPAMASASPVLTENGSAVAVGQKITALGEGTSKFIGNTGDVVECNDYWLTGEVHVNNGTEITGTITNASFNNKNASGVTEDCNSPTLGEIKVTIPGLVGQGGTEHWCIKSLVKDRFEVRGHGCTETAGPLTFVLDVTHTPLGEVRCAYKREASVTGEFTTNVTPATAKIVPPAAGEFEFKGETGNSFLCPATGELTALAVQFYTEDGTTGLTIS